jgi:hypothetical protein
MIDQKETQHPALQSMLGVLGWPTDFEPEVEAQSGGCLELEHDRE